MPIITDPYGNEIVTHGTQEEADRLQKMLEARHAFGLGYMKSKGWGDDVKALRIDQIMEIRAQDGWKNPNGGGNAN